MRSLISLALLANLAAHSGFWCAFVASTRTDILGAGVDDAGAVYDVGAGAECEAAGAALVGSGVTALSDR